MKKLLLAALSTIMLASPILAEIQTYTDQCLSFQYDDEMQGYVSKIVIPNQETHYNLETSDSQTGVAICNLPEGGIDEVLKNEESEYFKQTVISDDEFENYYTLTDLTLHSKIIAISDKQYAYITYDTGKLSDEAQEFMNSIQIDDSFKDGYVFDDIDTDMPKTIKVYRNKCYSEQAIVYAEQALNTCNQYLSFEITNKEASKTIEEIEKRARSYTESSQNVTDLDVTDALFLLNLKFSMSEDSEVIEARDELQRIVDAGAR